MLLEFSLFLFTMSTTDALLYASIDLDNFDDYFLSLLVGHTTDCVFVVPWKTNLKKTLIGGEFQDRLIPVPYSKSSTDQAVRVKTYSS